MSLYSSLDKCSGRFYNVKHILTYGKPWNFITGSRSIGKSTSLAIYAILDYIENGHKWIYCRRSNDEALLTANTFFGNAVSIINDKLGLNIASIIYEKKKYWITYEGELDEDDKPVRHECGMVIPLSLEQKYKSANLSEYHTIIYDEFIAKYTTGYLGTADTRDREYKAMLSLYQTVDRGIDKPYRNETRVFFLGNTASIYNPIMLSLGISEYVIKNRNAKIISPKKELWLLEQIETVDALEDIQQSWAYQLANEEEKQYGYENRAKEKTDDTFIRQPGVYRYMYALILGGVEYGLVEDDNGEHFIIPGNPKASARRYSLDIDGHDGLDLKLIDHMASNPITSMIRELYVHGKLYFSDARVKGAWLQYLDFMP